MTKKGEKIKRVLELFSATSRWFLDCVTTSSIVEMRKERSYFGVWHHFPHIKPNIVSYKRSTIFEDAVNTQYVKKMCILYWWWHLSPRSLEKRGNQKLQKKLLLKFVYKLKWITVWSTEMVMRHSKQINESTDWMIKPFVS